ncbi:hypothetical protein [Myxococcus xanthus]|uniref:hypothetical protein n=1 Tax=Myxococcus xanthus TaxID=34 RepID=UPI001375FB4F|nr:hypothetical protein [Myxococcus xanthus]
MMKGLLYVGLGLLALWVVLTVTRAVVGGLLWVVLIVGIAALAVYAFQVASGRRQMRG